MASYAFRHRLAAALLCLPVAPASAQPGETIRVERSPGLTGLWKMMVPSSIEISPFYTARFGAMKNSFFRIVQTGNVLELHYLDGAVQSGQGAVTGDDVHLSWGTPMARFVIDGKRAGKIIDGKFAFRLAGIKLEDSDPSRGAKIAPSEATPDRAGKSALLALALGQLAKGGLTLAHDNNAILRNQGGLPGDIGGLGALGAIAYLGQSPRRSDGSDPDFFSVYAVEFTGGERICGLHQRGDGTLDGFLCF